MIRTDSTTLARADDSMVQPAIAAAATPEQAAALYEAQARGAAAQADPVLGGHFVALQPVDILSLDQMTSKARPPAR
jgi:D-Tyr-tRNAtyr deacylase